MTEAVKQTPEMERYMQEIGGIKEQVKTLTTALESTVTAVRELAQSQVKPEKPVEGNGVTDDQWVEEWTNKPRETVTRTVKDEVGRSAKTLKDDVKKELKQEAREEGLQQQYDTQAFKNYPQLYDKEHVLYKETVSVIEQRERDNPKLKNDPRALYDASKLAYANLVERGEIMPDKFKQEIRRYMASNEGRTLPLHGGGKGGKGRPVLSSSEEFFAKRLKVPVEKYQEHREQLKERQPELFVGRDD